MQSSIAHSFRSGKGPVKMETCTKRADKDSGKDDDDHAEWRITIDHEDEVDREKHDRILNAESNVKECEREEAQKEIGEGAGTKEQGTKEQGTKEQGTKPPVKLSKDQEEEKNMLDSLQKNPGLVLRKWAKI